MEMLSQESNAHAVEVALMINKVMLATTAGPREAVVASLYNLSMLLTAGVKDGCSFQELKDDSVAAFIEILTHVYTTHQDLQKAKH